MHRIRQKGSTYKINPDFIVELLFSSEMLVYKMQILDSDNVKLLIYGSQHRFVLMCIERQNEIYRLRMNMNVKDRKTFDTTVHKQQDLSTFG